MYYFKYYLMLNMNVNISINLLKYIKIKIIFSYISRIVKLIQYNIIFNTIQYSTGLYTNLYYLTYIV